MEDKYMRVVLNVNGMLCLVEGVTKIDFVTSDEMKLKGHDTRNFTMFVRLTYMCRHSGYKTLELFYPCEHTSIVRCEQTDRP